ncbi:PREDICTED: uncharacterized protein LOC109183050 [Ipomoea nil]|uniref:uncharacterized protein LOC109183050 n=1 Tax=Ipomoea nil TaxID=35883 RepID=UPI000900C4C7|nr:PREDICTED: uncharacterized protein LOC109183050 [Ipomoea nil]
MVKPTTVRLLLALAVSRGWAVRQLDVHNSFLNGRLTKTVYMRQPPGAPRIFLGIETLDVDGAMVLSHHHYMTDILRRAGMEDFKPILTHVTTSRLCQFMNAPTTAQWVDLKRVLRYVKGTLALRLRISKSNSLDVHVFSDSDWAGYPVDRKSTSGFDIYLGGNLVSWAWWKQKTVARSSTEA